MKKLLLPILTLGLLTFSLQSCKDKCDNCAANETCVDGECVANEPAEDVQVTTNITADTHWTADNIYVLTKRVYVESGATLTIDPGTVIKGETGTGTNSKALIVSQGGRILAEGTAALPIIFTSVNDNITPEQVATGDFTSPNLSPTQQGLWGGVIILGNAKISASATSVQMEGIPTSETAIYGGTNDDDDSGILKYVSIRHTGTDIGTGNEIQALSLGGVGRGTVIENIELVCSKDDGVEFFGGAVNVTNALVWNVGDDGLDTDQGYSGTVTNFLVITPGGSALELDGPEGAPLANGNHTFNKGYIYGCTDYLVDCDDDTNVDITNIYFNGVPSGDTLVASIGDVIAAGSTISNWQYTMNSTYNASAVFYEVPATNLTSVAANAFTTGFDASVFGWTWASQYGELSNIGL
ncbi:MAG: hypothetical protein R2836_04000 [Chitinophagales bacterium]